jgi:hypothetical protein
LAAGQRAAGQQGELTFKSRGVGGVEVGQQRAGQQLLQLLL